MKRQGIKTFLAKFGFAICLILLVGTTFTLGFFIALGFYPPREFPIEINYVDYGNFTYYETINVSMYNESGDPIDNLNQIDEPMNFSMMLENGTLLYLDNISFIVIFNDIIPLMGFIIRDQNYGSLSKQRISANCLEFFDEYKSGFVQNYTYHLELNSNVIIASIIIFSNNLKIKQFNYA